MIGTNKIWYGKSNNAPIEFITTLNIGDYGIEPVIKIEKEFNDTVSMVYDNDLNDQSPDEGSNDNGYHIVNEFKVENSNDIAISGRMKISVTGNATITGSSIYWFDHTDPSDINWLNSYSYFFMGHSNTKLSNWTLNTILSPYMNKSGQIVSDNIILSHGILASSHSFTHTHTFNTTFFVESSDYVPCGLYARAYQKVETYRDYTYYTGVTGTIKLSNVKIVYTKI